MEKNITFSLIILFVFSVSCKQNANNESPGNQNTQIGKKVNSKFIYKKWISNTDSEEIYRSDGQIVQLKSFVDQEKNIGGKKVIVNNQEIDFVQSDSYVFKPFLFVFEDKELILVQEEDESGINGYLIYFFQDNVFLKKEYLSITPVKDFFSIYRYKRKNKSFCINRRIL